MSEYFKRVSYEQAGAVVRLVERSGLDFQLSAAFDCHLIQVIKRLIDRSFCFFLFLYHSFMLKKGAIVHSEEVGLTHDAHELLLSDLAITVAISLLDHLLDLVVSHVLAELLSNAL